MNEDLPLTFRQCAINGCKNRPWMLDPNRYPDGTEGNSSVCPDHWFKFVFQRRFRK